MTDFVQLLVAGISIGSIYALTAIGFVLLWQTSNTINFAQGEFVVVPAFSMVLFYVVWKLPFAAALAIAGLGQTLVVMQGGIDLSVAGGLSLYVVILTKYPAGVNTRLWPAIGLAVGAAIVAGLVNGFLIGRMRLNPIVATLGTNALLFGVVLWYSAARWYFNGFDSPGLTPSVSAARSKPLISLSEYR